MENHIYRIEMSDNQKIEFYISDTNELEPYRKVKEIGVTLIGKDKQADGFLDLEALSSLIRYLDYCKDYIKEYNEFSSKQTVANK